MYTKYVIMIIIINIYSEVAFDLTFHFESPDCDEIEDFSEGVELSVKRNDGDWIPLMFFGTHCNITEPYIKISENIEEKYFVLRGYTIPYVIQTKSARNYSVFICRDKIFKDKLQFRWLQTSYQRSQAARDVLMLENIIVRAWNCSNYVTLLSSINK